MAERVKIRQGWEGAGRTGYLLAVVCAQRVSDKVKRQQWSVVVWDDEYELDLHKTAGLETFG